MSCCPGCGHVYRCSCGCASCPRCMADLVESRVAGSIARGLADAGRAPGGAYARYLQQTGRAGGLPQVSALSSVPSGTDGTGE